MSLSLLHHAPGGDSSPVLGAPPITPAMEAALRRRCVEPLRRKENPATAWHHCDDASAWGAVLDLHQAGEHVVAVDLARLLRWCDQQFNGRSQGCWEIRRTNDLSEES